MFDTNHTPTQSTAYEEAKAVQNYSAYELNRKQQTKIRHHSPLSRTNINPSVNTNTYYTHRKAQSRHKANGAKPGLSP